MKGEASKSLKLFECTYCGEPVERNAPHKIIACFNCKQDRNRLNARMRNAKARLSTLTKDTR